MQAVKELAAGGRENQSYFPVFTFASLGSRPKGLSFKYLPMLKLRTSRCPYRADCFGSRDPTRSIEKEEDDKVPSMIVECALKSSQDRLSGDDPSVLGLFED